MSEPPRPPTEAEITARRIAELETDLAAARSAEQSERDRRLAAEASRDQWVTIARGRGLTTEQGSLWGDPQLAINAAYAEEARTRRRLEEQVSLVLRRDQTVEGLVRLVRLLTKLPVPVKKLHPDVALAVHWALGDRTTVIDAPAMSAAVRAELAVVAGEWDTVRRYSQATTAGNQAAADAARKALAR